MTVGPTVNPTSWVSTPCVAERLDEVGAERLHAAVVEALDLRPREEAGVRQRPVPDVDTRRRGWGRRDDRYLAGGLERGRRRRVVLAARSRRDDVVVVRRTLVLVLVLVLVAVVLVAVVGGRVTPLTPATQERAAGPPASEVARALRDPCRGPMGERAKGQSGEDHDADEGRGEQHDGRTGGPDDPGQRAADRDADPATRRREDGAARRHAGARGGEIAEPADREQHEAPADPDAERLGLGPGGDEQARGAEEPERQEEARPPEDAAQADVQPVPTEPERAEPAGQDEQRAERREPDDPQVTPVPAQQAAPLVRWLLASGSTRRAGARVGRR